MMTRNKFSRHKLGVFALVLFFSTASAFSQTTTKWTIATEKFKFPQGQSSNAVTEATAEMLPARILEQLGQKLIRAISPDERLDRFYYDSRKERLSLFLQLTSAYKKRDSLVLNNYSKRELQKKISEEEKNIKVVQDKIDANLKALKEQEEKTEKLKTQEVKTQNDEQRSSSELFKYSNLFKNLFVKNEPVFTPEDIAFYRDDITALYTPGTEAAAAGYLSYAFEKECVNNGVNTLLTGTISLYGDYVSVTLGIYQYPNAKLLASVMEVGSTAEFDLLASNLARQILPVLTNAMPVQIQFAVGPEGSNKRLYIDDVLQDSFTDVLLLDSGVHSLQFTAEGYESVSTSYFFEGNKNYLIEVMLQEKQVGSMEIGIVRPPLDLFIQSLPLTKNYSDVGNVYYNGVRTEYDDEGHSVIAINGNKILGQFVSEDGTGALFYVPQKLIYDGSMISLNPKPFDRSKYIDTRRKWMYASYSLFITSLVPAFYCYGRYENLARRWNTLLNSREDYEEALAMQNKVYLTAGISVALGSFFAVELFRYFDAANSVLPEKAKKAKEVKPIKSPDQKDEKLSQTEVSPVEGELTVLEQELTEETTDQEEAVLESEQNQEEE